MIKFIRRRLYEKLSRYEGVVSRAIITKRVIPWTQEFDNLKKQNKITHQKTIINIDLLFTIIVIEKISKVKTKIDT